MSKHEEAHSALSIATPGPVRSEPDPQGAHTANDCLSSILQVLVPSHSFIKSLPHLHVVYNEICLLPNQSSGMLLEIYMKIKHVLLH